MHNYYIKIRHGQFCPGLLQFMKHIQPAVTHTLNMETLTRPNVYYYFLFATVPIYRSCSQLMGQPSCIHA